MRVVPVPQPSTKPEVLEKIKEGINSERIKASSMKGMWEQQLHKINSDVAKSKESWNSFTHSVSGSGHSKESSSPTLPPKYPPLHHTVSITEAPED